jgi:hypothetical protein
MRKGQKRSAAQKNVGINMYALPECKGKQQKNNFNETEIP